MDSLISTLNDVKTLERLVFFLVFAVLVTLGILVFIYSRRAERYERLYADASKEAKLQGRLKTVYEAELKTFANLMDEITFPIWQRDKNLKLIYVNKRFCEITGEIREQILENGGTELFRDSQDFAKRALKTGQVQVMEQNIVIGGSSTLNQIVEIPLNDKSGGFVGKSGTIGLSLNFSELQNTRERLKLNVELQRRLLESLASAVAIYGSNQKLEYYNKAFVELWKFDEDWLKTYPTYGEILENLRQRRKLPEQADFASFKKDNLAMFSNLIQKKEDYYYLTDGTVLQVIIIPYQQRGLLFFYEDVTRQLTMERSYNTALSVQRQTIDKLNDAVAVFAEDGKIKLYNNNFATLWGLPIEYLKAEPHISQVIDEMSVLYTLDDKLAFKEDFISKMNLRKVEERKMVRSDGIVLLEKFNPLPDGATLLTYLDITDKENVERSIMAEKKAYEEADRIKTNFLGNVSYELRSPLTSIMGFADLLISGYAGKTDDKAKEYLSAILTSSQKLKELIDNIIDVSSIDAGFVALDIAEVNISEIIDPLLSEVKTDGYKSKVGVSVDVSKNVDTLRADKERLTQAIRTIINYSISMCRPNDRVILEVRMKGPKMRFEITDNGKGIPPEDLTLIFDQFYRTHSDNSHGTGLGLYTAKKVIEMHGGIIDVHSQVDKGTKFTFEITAKDR